MGVELGEKEKRKEWQGDVAGNRLDGYITITAITDIINK